MNETKPMKYAPEPLSEIAASHADRLNKAAHGMQTGVKLKMNLPQPVAYEGETSPKHLRVGVNSALTNVAALATLLIHKGLITQDEYLEACAEWMESERDRYQAEIRSLMGNENIHLG